MLSMCVGEGACVRVCVYAYLFHERGQIGVH